MSAPRELRRTTHPSTTTRADGPTITALVRRLTDSDGTAREHLIEEFWQDAARQAPIMEPAAEPGMNVVTFVWRGDAHAVLVTVNRVTNDLESSRMRRIAGTDIWHAGFLLANDWRGSYTMMAVDTDGLAELEDAGPRAAMGIIRARGVPDPRNPNSTFTHGCRIASVAQLGAAPPQVWFTAPSSAESAHPIGHEHLLPNGRRVWVHDPRPGAAGPRPLVINLDGDVWYRSGYAASTVGTLVDRAAVPAPLVLMIDPGSSMQRTADLHIDGPMAAELVDIVLPWARAHLPVRQRAGDVVVCGESLGGLTALKVAFDYPQHVGAALAQSSSLWQHDMLDRVAQATAGTRLYLTVGSKESLLLEPNRAFAQALRHSPVQHTYVEFNGGHDMACWRGYYGDGLLELLGR